ncbi:MAG: FAD-dependent oxidoreductase [Pikeienuella sp.]|uniref:FAD-dependent oxidoreductase n=1 Tax=Pikeienuella sp. TaxID=2831957 RepID=UPI00391DA6A0
MNSETDILIVGGGVAGLTAAALFAASGRRVTLADRESAEAGMRDSRTTAFLRPAVDLLEEAGVWPLLAAEIAPLETMRLIDAGGRENKAREIGDFVAAELGQPGFGWNVPNSAMRRALRERLSGLPEACILNEAALEALTVRRDCAIARLSTGETIRARLVIGADGRESAVRRLSGIHARRTEYGQKALVFTVAHEEPHRAVSTEIHRTGGPFTLVPMPDGPDGPRSSVVWMERSAEAERLLGLPEPEFEEAANGRSLGVLGRLRVVSHRAAWPMISLMAQRLTGPRVALVAEAAHVVPPIGAQGLNMSLGDLAALRAAMGEGDAGAPAALARYARRWPELAARVAGVDALNRAAMAEAQPLRDLRRLGLGALIRVRPARRLAMKLGMGVR